MRGRSPPECILLLFVIVSFEAFGVLDSCRVVGGSARGGCLYSLTGSAVGHRSIAPGCFTFHFAHYLLEVDRPI